MIRIEMDPGVAGKFDKIGKAINKGLAFTLTDSAKFANEDLLTALRGETETSSPETRRRMTISRARSRSAARAGPRRSPRPCCGFAAPARATS
ncbi:hypothetical protein ACVI1J_001843 [Bradyrhizobium diazoefficiens]